MWNSAKFSEKFGKEAYKLLTIKFWNEILIRLEKKKSVVCSL